jgi:thioredoxin 1
MTEHFNENNFDEAVIKASSAKPVLVDFFATWCGPCQLQLPIIDEVANEIGEKAVVGKVNIEEAPLNAEKFEVMSVPTLIIFKNGEIVERFVGLQHKDVLVTALKKYA